jgi:hypothetical protein
LRISQPGDAYEQEADRIADQVMQVVEPTSIRSAPASIGRKCGECEDKMKTVEREPSVVVQRSSKEATTRPVALQGVEGQEEEYSFFGQHVIFRKSEFATPRATTGSTAVTDLLVPHQTKGEPLPEATCASMEDAFGYDFSRVRIHRDAEAAEMSQRISALAFTYRNHIYFDHGVYDPSRSSGTHLLAHELTHVIQQRAKQTCKAKTDRPVLRL